MSESSSDKKSMGESLYDKKSMGERLERARIAAGYKTAQSFAAKAEVSQGGYSLQENGKRGLSDATAQLYADLLDVDASWIKWGSGHGPKVDAEPNTEDGPTTHIEEKTTASSFERVGLPQLSEHSIALLGAVQAGAWEEGPLWSDLPEDELTKFSVPTLPPYKNYFGVEVRGDSMDLDYPEGSILVCLPLHEFPRALRSGDHVIVERHENSTVETTVKEIQKGPDLELYLVPRSKNPRYNSTRFPKIRPQDDTGMPPIRVSAVVVASYVLRSII